MLNANREQSIVNNLSTMNEAQLLKTMKLLVESNPELADKVEFLINLCLKYESKETQNAS
jgi:hypothetical protein